MVDLNFADQTLHIQVIDSIFNKYFKRVPNYYFVMFRKYRTVYSHQERSRKIVEDISNYLDLVIIKILNSKRNFYFIIRSFQLNLTNKGITL